MLTVKRYQPSLSGNWSSIARKTGRCFESRCASAVSPEPAFHREFDRRSFAAMFEVGADDREILCRFRSERAISTLASFRTMPASNAATLVCSQAFVGLESNLLSPSL
jgi:hypothetical protein